MIHDKGQIIGQIVIFYDTIFIPDKVIKCVKKQKYPVYMLNVQYFWTSSTFVQLNVSCTWKTDWTTIVPALNLITCVERLPVESYFMQCLTAWGSHCSIFIRRYIM